jgi:hypothetical protein
VPQATSITGPTNDSASGTLIAVEGGNVTVTGGSDTVVSSVNGIGVYLVGSSNVISVSSSDSTIFGGASVLGSSASSHDLLYLAGSYNTVHDYGFANGGITITGSHNNIGSNQKIESVTAVISGSNNSVSGLYLAGNFTVSGNSNYLVVGGASITISGNNDTVVSANAKTIVITGNNDKIVNDAIPGEALPYDLLLGVGSANSTTPGTAISITGANANVTTYNNNDSINSSGGAATINAESYVNELSSSGASADISTAPVDENVTVSGGSTTVSTSFSGGPSSSIAGASVVFTGAASTNSVYNEGATFVNDTVGSATPVEVNITNTNVTVYGGNDYTFNDSVGGNRYTLTSGTHVDISAGADTVTFGNYQFGPGETISGTASHANTIIFGSYDYYLGNTGSVLGTHNVLDVNGSLNGGVVYAADMDTLNVEGSGNVFTVLSTPASFGSTITGGIHATVNGAGDTVGFYINANTIMGGSGGFVVADSNNNVITGTGFTADVVGSGNQVSTTGSATISSASPYAYATMNATIPATQNFFTVQGGSFDLGGLDSLVQTSGTAQISLAGGNTVTVGGFNDTVSVFDQVYGGNVITDTGAGAHFNVTNVANSTATISASATALVKISDDTVVSAKIGASKNDNSGESLTFIASGSSGNSVLGAGTKTAIIFTAQGNSTSNVVTGGTSGGNSLSGGAGGHDLFVAGGTGDVLIGGTAGANTLVSAAGLETLTGSAAGTDLFSIMGGGGTDVINGFTGTLKLTSGLSMSSETVTGGSMHMTLNDGTTLIFASVTSLAQNGNTFTL